jgi:hypothetical protein
MVLALLLLSLVTVAADVAAPVAVKITKRVPIQALGADGSPTGVSMSAPGTSLTFVRINEDQIVLRGADGTTYMIAIAATDYAPPAQATPASPTVATLNKPPAVSVQPPTAPPIPDQSDIAEKLNKAFGTVPIFSAGDFWNSSLDDIEKKFNHFSPTVTGNDVMYCDGDCFADKTISIFGCPAHSFAVEGKKGKPRYVTILFQNMAQSPEAANRDAPTSKEIDDVRKAVADDIAHDQQTISTAMTALFGEPSKRVVSRTPENTRDVQRWNWQEVSFLLSCRAGAYLYMEIMPKAEADRVESGAAPSRRGVDEEIAKRVNTAPNGDVMLTQVPETAEFGAFGGTSVDAWQRYLRYMEVPGDAYIISALFMHNFSVHGSGGDASNFLPAINDYLTPYHCRMERVEGGVSMDSIANSIDAGVPLIWTGFLYGEDEINAKAHAKDRQSGFDVAAHRMQLNKEDEDRESLQGQPTISDFDTYAMLVVGYNKDTQEIALEGDTSGDKSTIEWITIRTARRLVPHGLRRLSWDSDQ